jgi:peptide/nickel transport system permease protein
MTQVADVSGNRQPSKGVRRGWRHRFFLRFQRNPMGVISAFIVIGLILVAIFADLLSPFDPAKIAAGPRLTSPSLRYPFGTDQLGRDMLSRIIAGTRVALFLSSASIMTGTLIGTLIGLISGWMEGIIDQILQRLIDALMSIPGLVLALALVAMLGPGFDKIIIALSVFSIPTVTRTVRGTVLSAKRNTYVEAARSIGCPTYRLLLRHILPNVAAPLIIIMTLQLGTVILGEAALSFLGLGVQPPSVSWGQMLSGPARRMMEQAPWLVVFPTLAISITVLSINFLGDTLRDIWDPKLRGSQ